jgi:V8-like Glu-specific endopeptidase
MAFAGHLTYDELQDVYQAALTAGLDGPGVRDVLLQGINPQYRALLPSPPNPQLQLLSDLQRLNAVDRLVDGTVPLVVWLRNASTLTAALVEGQVIRKALDEVGRKVSNEPPVVVPANVAEIAEAIVHEDDLLAYSFLDRGAKAGVAVVRLLFPSYENGQARLTANGNVEMHAGTGWMITPDLVVTNHHVIVAREQGEPAPAAADLTRQIADGHAEFGYDFLDAPADQIGFKGLEATDATLDFAILRLQKAFAGNPLRLGPRPLSVKPNRGPALNIIQHPSGGPKQVAIRNNLASEATTTDVTYFTDTREGSSGAPVFDDQWLVMALHRASTVAENVKFQGRTTAVVNVGTQIHAILAEIRNTQPLLADEIQAVQQL